MGAAKALTSATGAAFALSMPTTSNSGPKLHRPESQLGWEARLDLDRMELMTALVTGVRFRRRHRASYSPAYFWRGENKASSVCSSGLPLNLPTSRLTVGRQWK